MKRLRLKPKEERRLLRGHLWAYRNEFADTPDLEDGTVVEVYADRGRFVGRGFYQAEGGIAVRMLTRRQVDIDRGFLADRLGRALEFRKRMLGTGFLEDLGTGFLEDLGTGFREDAVYRWIHGESDAMPGFVADRYGEVVTASSPCAFYASVGEELAEAFLSHDGVSGVRLEVRGDVSRWGAVPEETTCSMDGVKLTVDLERGQKTGLFLDQRLNALAVRAHAPGARVLDGHCYVGLWSCHAALGGAREVRGIDSSEHAVRRAAEHARLNNVDKVCRFETGDIAKVLAEGESYDCVVLDPPTLAKSRSQAAKALGLYQALNRDAMKTVSPGGVLVTSCCSHFVPRERFLETLKRAAAAAQRSVWVVDVRGPGPDHPVLMAMPETAYLTCVTLRVL